MTILNNGITSVAGILVASLLFGVAFDHPASGATDQKTIDIQAFYSGGHAAGATCNVLTNASPVPIVTTTNGAGKAQVTVPSSATSAAITCVLGSLVGQAQVQLTQQTTSVTLFLT